MIHPGRWVIPKKQMENVHNNIIDNGLFRFDWYPNANDIFNGVSIDGGVTITMLDKSRKPPIHYYNNGNYMGPFSDSEKFFSDNYEREAYEKTHRIGERTIAERVVGSIGSLGGCEFGYSKQNYIQFLKDSPKGMKNPIRIWANNEFGRGTRFSWHYIEKSILDSFPKEILSSRKVMIDKKGNAITFGRGNVINNIPQIVGKDVTASGDVLFVFPEHDTDYELQLIKSMFMTKTVRFLMTITQKDLYVRGFENVPDYTYFIPMLNGKLITDEFFYRKFHFSQELIDYIEKSVSPKE